MTGELPAGSRAFVDSNVWLYAFIEGDDPQKTAVAKSIVENSSMILSVQVINEVCRNLLRKAKFTESEIQTLIGSFFGKYSVIPCEQTTLLHASELRFKYQFAFWDGLIVATALLADAAIIYSEDMQDGLVVEGRLRILNPFRTAVRK
jgi:predicted nucleic acid-binding protein